MKPQDAKFLATAESITAAEDASDEHGVGQDSVRSDLRRLRRPIDPNTFRFTLLLGFLGALPPLSIDISAPTLLMVQDQLGATDSAAGMVITLFMLGFAVGQFSAGPISDRSGRKPVLLVGLLCFTAAAVGCASATAIEHLLFWRLVQGMGAGSCAVLTFAMIRDLFDGNLARSKRSYLTVIFGVAPMLAPLLGAWIMSVTGWRCVYITLAAGGVVLLVLVVFGVAESRPVSDGAVPAPRLLSACRTVLQSRHFVTMVGTNALGYAAVFTYIAASPLVVMGSFDLPPSGYGLVFASTAAMLTFGAWVSGRCAKRNVPIERVLNWGMAAAAAATVAGAALLLSPKAGVAAMLPPLMVTMFCRGLTAPNVQHLALEPMQFAAGTAASVMGVIQILAGTLASAAVALLYPVLDAGAMGVLMAVFAVGAAMLWLLRPSATAVAAPG